MNKDKRFVDPDTAFTICFNTDNEREQYMYMYSVEDMHYFKHVETREYVHFERKGLN